MHLLPRIARSDPAAGYATEALAAAIAQGDNGGQGTPQGVSGKTRPKVSRNN